MNFIRLNTAFIPPKEVSEKAIELSKAISSSADAYFVLDGIQSYPHITIYPPEYPEENVAKLLETVDQITKSLSQLDFKFKNLDSGQGYLGVAFEHSDEIQQVHEKLVSVLNPLREGRIRDKYAEYYMKFNSEQLQNIERYGYPGAMNLYNPHLTITRLKNEDEAEQALSDIRWDILEFMVNKIGVYKMGEHGTCRELVKEFNLR